MIEYDRGVRVLLVCLSLLASCYSPNLRDCMLTCAAGNKCPNGLECHDNYCREPNATTSCLDVEDAGADTITIDELPDGNPDEDFDGDGANDAIDNCRFLANMDQANEDMDAFGDVCDPCPPFGMADANVDSDGDKVGDGCDPFPNLPGERIRIFAGFSVMPPNTMQLGAAGFWSLTNGRVRGAAPATDALGALLWDPMLDPLRREFVSSRLEIVDFQMSNMPRSSGVVLAYDTTTHQSAACVLGLASNGAPNLFVLQTTMASDMIVGLTSEIAANGGGMVRNIILDERSTGFGCTTPTSATSGSPLTSGATRVGLRVRGESAEFDWFMLVDSTN